MGSCKEFIIIGEHGEERERKRKREKINSFLSSGDLSTFAAAPMIIINFRGWMDGFSLCLLFICGSAVLYSAILCFPVTQKKILKKY